jgi:hypothetical protein
MSHIGEARYFRKAARGLREKAAKAKSVAERERLLREARDCEDDARCAWQAARHDP